MNETHRFFAARTQLQKPNQPEGNVCPLAIAVKTEKSAESVARSLQICVFHDDEKGS